MNVYEIVTNRIIEQLEVGTVPWRKPWNGKPAHNWTSGKVYSGINAVLLRGGEYATFNQITQAGGKVKKGAKSEIVVFFTQASAKKIVNGEEKTEFFPILKYYNVFEINEDCEGLTSKIERNEASANPIEDCERITTEYLHRANAPTLEHSGRPRAYYQISSDRVHMPDRTFFHTPEEYYSTLFHELIHSTGHADRLNRKEMSGMSFFGDEAYSKEELTAEMGAAFLCNMTCIDHATISNSASYLQSWLKALKNDKKLIISAASLAQKAVQYITGTEPIT